MKREIIISYLFGILALCVGLIFFKADESGGSIMSITMGLILIIGASLQSFIDSKSSGGANNG